MDRFLMWLNGTLGVIILLIYIFAFAIFSSWLASQKGYSPLYWFFIGFSFNILGVLVIGFAPDRNSRYKNTLENIERRLLQLVPANGTPGVPLKTMEHNEAVDKYRVKNVNLPAVWTCGNCGTKNPSSSDHCKDCGNYRK